MAAQAAASRSWLRLLNVPGIDAIEDRIGNLGDYAALKYTPLGDFVAEQILNFFALHAGVRPVADAGAATPRRDEAHDAVKETVALGALLETFGEDLAEIATESISDSLSNMLYSGWLGALDAYMRLTRGLIPIQSPTYDTRVDAELRAWIDAMSGLHYHPLVAGMLSQLLKELEDAFWQDQVTRGIIESWRAAADPTVYAASRYHEMVWWATTRALEVIAAALEALVVRVNDAVQEYIAAKWLYEQGIMDAGDYAKIKAKVEAELTAAEYELQFLVEDMGSALAGADWSPPQTLAELRDALIGLWRDAVKNAVQSDGRAYRVKVDQLRYDSKPEGVVYAVRETETGEVVEA